MMHKTIAAALLLLLPVGALAQDALPVETVAVENDSLAGVWKFAIPRSFALHLFSKTEWGSRMDDFCRIEDMQGDLSVHCPGLSLGHEPISRGTVQRNGNGIRMEWKAGAMHFVIDGTLRSAVQFDGSVQVSTLLLSSKAPTRVTGTKLFLSENLPDAGGKSALLARLLNEMAAGTPVGNFDAKTRLNFLTPQMLLPLGAIQTITYLGEKSFDRDGAISVYDVEFADTHLICELRQSDGGALDYFDCG